MNMDHFLWIRKMSQRELSEDKQEKITISDIDWRKNQLESIRRRRGGIRDTSSRSLDMRTVSSSNWRTLKSQIDVLFKSPRLQISFCTLKATVTWNLEHHDSPAGPLDNGEIREWHQYGEFKICQLMAHHRLRNYGAEPHTGTADILKVEADTFLRRTAWGEDGERGECNPVVNSNAKSSTNCYAEAI